MNTTLDTLKACTTHNTILPQRIRRPLSNHTRQHHSRRRYSLDLHVRRKLVIIRQQPHRLCRSSLIPAVLDNLLHFGFVEAFADDDGHGPRRRGK